MSRIRSGIPASALALLAAGCSTYHLDPHEVVTLGRFTDCSLRVANHGPAAVEVWTRAALTKPRAAQVEPGHVVEFQLPPVMGTEVGLRNLGDRPATVDVESKQIQATDADTPAPSASPK